MTIIFFLALLVYLLICIVLVPLILMQEGKGGGLSGVMGASMGETFGFGGASKQIRKYTAVMAGVFMAMTIVLTFLGEAAMRSTAAEFIGTDEPTATAPAPVTVTPNTGATPAPAENATPAQIPAEATPVAEAVIAPEAETTPAVADATPAATEATPAATEATPAATPAE